MKKIFAAFLMLLLFLGTFSISWGGQPVTTLEEALKGANEELRVLYPERPEIADGYFKTTNLSGKPQNPDRWKESDRRLFVYGEPYGDIKIDEKGSLRYRYIGETAMGEDFLNPFFPHDEWRAGLKLENFMLYHEPWKEPALKGFKIYGKPFRFMPNPFNGQGKYLPYIQEGLKRYWADGIIGESHPMWSKWHEYVYIQQPPTKWTWGLGSAFHIDSRGIKWYIPIPLPSEMDLVVPDLRTNLETDSFKGIKPGDKITSTVAYSLNADHPRPERAWLQLHHVVDGQEYSVQLEPVNGAPVPDEKGYIIINPGETKVYKYTITVQSTKSIVRTRVNPIDSTEDKDWSNNRAEAQVVSAMFDVKIELTSDRYTLTILPNGGGDRANVTVRITRKDYIPVELPINITLHTGNPVVIPMNLGPGGTHVINLPFASWNTTTISGEVWPDGMDDANPLDNVDSITITVNHITIPPEDNKIRPGLIN